MEFGHNDKKNRFHQERLGSLFLYTVEKNWLVLECGITTTLIAVHRICLGQTGMHRFSRYNWFSGLKFGEKASLPCDRWYCYETRSNKNPSKGLLLFKFHQKELVFLLSITILYLPLNFHKCSDLYGNSSKTELQFQNIHTNSNLKVKTRYISGENLQRCESKTPGYLWSLGFS